MSSPAPVSGASAPASDVSSPASGASAPASGASTVFQGSTISSTNPLLRNLIPPKDIFNGIPRVHGQHSLEDDRTPSGTTILTILPETDLHSG